MDGGKGCQSWRTPSSHLELLHAPEDARNSQPLRHKLARQPLIQCMPLPRSHCDTNSLVSLSSSACPSHAVTATLRRCCSWLSAHKNWHWQTKQQRWVPVQATASKRRSRARLRAEPSKSASRGRLSRFGAGRIALWPGPAPGPPLLNSLWLTALIPAAAWHLLRRRQHPMMIWPVARIRRQGLQAPYLATLEARSTTSGRQDTRWASQGMPQATACGCSCRTAACCSCGRWGERMWVESLAGLGTDSWLVGQVLCMLITTQAWNSD
jgi:hypothetical protein